MKFTAMGMPIRPPKLHSCRLSSGSFYLLEEGPFQEEAIVFLHGLGESRSGINYLFSDLSQKLTDDFTVYRFDLAGCGDSALPLSVPLWREQMDSLNKNYLSRHKTVQFISRGFSSILLPEGGIALNPPNPDFVLSIIDQIPLVPHSTFWIPIGNREMGLAEEHFWFQLGIEAGCLGGFSLPSAFLKDQIRPSQPSTVIYSGDRWPMPLPPHAIRLKDCHPLFLYQNNRIELAAKIKDLLKKNQNRFVFMSRI